MHIKKKEVHHNIGKGLLDTLLEHEERGIDKTAASPMHYALAGGGIGGLTGAALNKKDRIQGALTGAVTGAAVGGLGSMLGSRAGQSATIPTAPKIEIDTKVVTKSMDKVKQHAQRKAHELHSKGLRASLNSISKKIDAKKADIAKLKKELKGNYPDFNVWQKKKQDLRMEELRLDKLQEQFNDKSNQFIEHFPKTWNF